MRKNSYDQFYNEHIYVFSAIALQNILKNNLEIYDIENIKVHGGSNRYYIKKKNNKIKLTKRFKRNMILERKMDCINFRPIKNFQRRSKSLKLTSSD